MYNAWMVFILNARRRVHAKWNHTWKHGHCTTGTANGVIGLSLAAGYYSQYPVYRGNHNIEAWYNKVGGLAAEIKYDAYGLIVAKTGQPFANFGFQTQYTDLSTGLICYEQRWYDPRTQSWVSLDPIEEQGGVNLYGFCRGNGLKHFDVFGKAMVIETKNFTNIVKYAELLSLLGDNIHPNRWTTTHPLVGPIAYAGRVNLCTDGDPYEPAGYTLARWAEVTEMKRFIYTNNGGWVNLKHLFEAASLAVAWYIPNRTILYFGETVEKDQDSEHATSAYAIGDLPSNAFGVALGSRVRVAGARGPALIELFKTFVISLGDVVEPHPSLSLIADPASPFGQKRNHTYTPILVHPQ